MIRGHVTPLGEALVVIHLFSNDHQYSHPAVIDTGFNGYLSLPENIAKKYGWHFFGLESYEIATGDIVQQKVYIGAISFDKKKREVYAVTSHANDILIGTQLLSQNDLWISFRKKKVRIS